MKTLYKTLFKDIALGFFIVVVAVVVFWRVTACGFVDYDDPAYVTENNRVLGGLSGSNMVWAFTHTYSHWIPLDTISHMADCQMFGVNPVGHHAVNLALHAANALLFFIILRVATGAVWPSALAAAFFALHPVNVEPVTWISSRKDVLSTFFGLITLGVYLAYVTRNTVWRYGLVVLFYIAALLAKPMVLTLPVLLLLFDYWPLHRFDVANLRALPRLILEKLPLFALSILSSIITYLAQRQADSVMSADAFPFLVRATNAFVSHLVYLRKLIIPYGFSVFYPHPGATLPVSLGLVALFVLLSITVIALWLQWRVPRAPWFSVGWLWFLCALVPVSGLFFQLAGSAMADRYLYLPMMGLCMTEAWALYAIAQKWRVAIPVVALGSIAVLVTFGGVSAIQIGHWKDTESLWNHALLVTRDNAQAHNGLGAFYLKRQCPDLAASHLTEALRLAPTFYLAHNNYGLLLGMRGDFAGAAKEFERAIALKPNYAKAYANLAKCKLEMEQLAEARQLFVKSIHYAEPDDPTRPQLENIIQQIDALQKQGR